jgi:hypothetical protein
LAVGGVESLIDHHGPGDAGRAGRPVRAAKRIKQSVGQFPLFAGSSKRLFAVRAASAAFAAAARCRFPRRKSKAALLAPHRRGRLKVKTPLTAS